MKFQNNHVVISKSIACLVKAPPEENRVKMATSDKDAAHRNVIKFCFDLGLTPVETQKKLQLTEDHRHVSRSLVSTVREVGEKLGLSKTSVHRVLNKDLSMNKVCARWIPDF